MSFAYRSAWQINIPDLPLDPYNFQFTSNLPDGAFTFVFRWFNNIWNIWVTLPSGEIRQAGGHSNVLSWTGFADYLFRLNTSLDKIQQNDLANVQMVVYKR